MDIYFHIVRNKISTHSQSWALLEKPPVVQLLKNFSAFYGTRRFSTVFTRALHWFLSRARSIHSVTSHPISLRYILILSSRLRLGLHSCLFPSGFPTNILYALPFSRIRATCPALSSSLTLSNKISTKFKKYFKETICTIEYYRLGCDAVLSGRNLPIFVWKVRKFTLNCTASWLKR
jgi:hypothetical protein